MNKIYEEFFKIGIVPVVALKDASDAEPLAKALRDGGLPCAEVTFRTEAAQDAIRSMTEKFPDMLIGAASGSKIIVIYWIHYCSLNQLFIGIV